MCGIVGAVTHALNGFDYHEVNMIQDMLYADTLRGLDSTGVFSVTNKGNLHLLKEASPGFKFLGTRDWKDFKGDLTSRGKFFVGHNRAATRGTVNDKNAHPFVVDDKIVLVQNGTYKGSHYHIKNTDVDTEAIAHLLAEEPDISKALKQVNAAYALVWYDVTKQTLHLIRNDERPLYVVNTKKGGFVFASEPGIIMFAASRNNVELATKPYLYDDYTLGSIVLHDDGDYETDFTKIDAKYEHKGTIVSFPRTTSWEVDDSAWYGDMSCFGSDDAVDDAHILPTDQDPSYRKYRVGELVKKLKEKSLFTFNEINSLTTKYHRDSKVILETVDYLPLNDHPKCAVFAVFFKELRTEENTKEPFFHVIVGDTDEESVLTDYYDKLFKGKASSVISDYIENTNEPRLYTASIPVFDIGILPVTSLTNEVKDEEKKTH